MLVAEPGVVHGGMFCPLETVSRMVLPGLTRLLPTGLWAITRRAGIVSPACWMVNRGLVMADLIVASAVGRASPVTRGMDVVAGCCGPVCDGAARKLASIVLTGVIQWSENALAPNLAVRLSVVPPVFTHKDPVTGEPARELPKFRSLKLIGGEA